MTDAQRRRVGRDRVQRVGIDHDRHGSLGDEAPDGRLGPVVAAETGPDGERAEATEILQHEPRRFLVEMPVVVAGSARATISVPANSAAASTPGTPHTTMPAPLRPRRDRQQRRAESSRSSRRTP